MSRVQASALIGVALAIALFVSLPQARGVAQEATPAADCPATTPEENKELVDRWFAALSGGTSEDMAGLAAADIIYHDPSPREEAQTGGTEEWASDRDAGLPGLAGHGRASDRRGRHGRLLPALYGNTARRRRG